MISVDYRMDKTGGHFYVALSVLDDRLTTVIRSINDVTMRTDSAISWDGRASVWVVARWAIDSFMIALRSAYPDDPPVMTPRAEEAAIEEFVDRTTNGSLDDADAAMAWSTFSVRTDAPWPIVVVAARAVAWSFLEASRRGKIDLRLSTVVSERGVIIAFTRLHKAYGELEVPGDLVDLLRRMAATYDAGITFTKAGKHSTVSSMFVNWEKRMADKIVYEKK